MATTAPPTSFMASNVASIGWRCSSSILAYTASTTTIPLSTTIPIANTNANKVNRLMEKPSICIQNSAPIKHTGTAKIGIIVALKSCKKINTTIKTKRNASNKVLITEDIEASKNRDTSYPIV